MPPPRDADYDIPRLPIGAQPQRSVAASSQGPHSHVTDEDGFHQALGYLSKAIAQSGENITHFSSARADSLDSASMFSGPQFDGPCEVVQLLFDVAFDRVDLEEFKGDLLASMLELGALRKELTQLAFSLQKSRGGIIAQVKGPMNIMRTLQKKIDLAEINVLGCKAFFSWEEAEAARQSQASSAAMEQLLGNLRPKGEMKPPSEAEIEAMVARIAAARQMSDAQATNVRSMLVDLSKTLFGAEVEAPEPKTPISASSVESVGASLRRPTSTELNAVAEKTGISQVPAAQAMLQLMTDVLFGDEASSSSATRQVEGLAAGAARPTADTLEAITKRVVARTGDKSQEQQVRTMLLSLTDAIFAGGMDARSLSHSASGTGSGSSELNTARSSVRSGSDTSEQFKEDINVEVHGLLTELCGTLFTSDDLP